MDYEVFMREAIELAKRAGESNEVPIGCVIEYNGEIIGRGYNMRNTLKSSLAHAELIAIEQAAKHIGDWRLDGCTLFVTLEPCPMCSGAIVTARIKTAVFGARNPKAGCCGSVMNIVQAKGLNHCVEIVEGICRDECSALLTDFFARLRLGKLV